jgi:hypothetical protein
LWIEFVDTLAIDGNEIVEIIKKVVKQFELKRTIVFTTNEGSDIVMFNIFHKQNKKMNWIF